MIFVEHFYKNRHVELPCVSALIAQADSTHLSCCSAGAILTALAGYPNILLRLGRPCDLCPDWGSSPALDKLLHLKRWSNGQLVNTSVCLSLQIEGGCRLWARHECWLAKHMTANIFIVWGMWSDVHCRSRSTSHPNDLQKWDKTQQSS